GLLGPVFLLAPIALLALRRREGRALLAAFAVFFLPYFANVGTRFTIPSLPFLALAMALALVNVPVALAAMAILHVVICWPSVVRHYAPVTWRVERPLVRPALRLIPEDRWLSQSATYVAARMIQRDVPRGERVFALNGTAEAYTTRDIMVRFESAQAETLGEVLFAGLSPISQPTHIEDFRFPPRKLQKLRAVQTAKGGGLWSISEFRLYNGSAELARDPRWRLTACPNPWEVQYAFDNSPVTRWLSWQAMLPGMFVEVDLNPPQTLDRVRLECAIDQPDARVELEGMDDGGRWTALSAHPEESDIPPLRGMRLAATEALKRHGIHYMLTAPDDFGSGDYRANASQWGFTLVQEQAGMRLYRLDGVK
ncbi:MAG: discoidin domain-containing protein, partial [Bryobacteraceae bacterium]